MKQEEQKVRKLENGKPEPLGSKRQQASIYGNPGSFPSTSAPQNVMIPNAGPVNQNFAQNPQNVYFVTTPLPQQNMPVSMKPMLQTSGNSQIRKASSPRIPTQVSHNIESSPLPGSSSDPLNPIHTETQMIAVPSTNAKSVSAKSNSFAVVTHHDLPRKNTVNLNYIIFFHKTFQQFSSDPLSQNKEISSSAKSPVSRTSSSGKPPSPLHAQITTTPLPPKPKPDQICETSRSQETSKQFHPQGQVNVYQDPTTINPQLLPHRQLNFRKIQEEQMKEEQSRQIQQARMNPNTTTMIIAPQQQMIVGPQGQMQHIVIPSSNFQQVPLIQSQPKLREALQNAGKEARRQSTVPQPIQLVQAVVPNQSRIVASSGAQIAPDNPNSQMVIDDNRGIIYIDQSRVTFGSRGEMIVPIGGSQTVRYLVPQTQMPQTITIAAQNAHSSEKIIQNPAIDHMLSQNPDSSALNDDNIDWSKYDEPKPKSKKNATPKKRGANIKVDANSDAMARISPILAKFQQEMAQSTVAQEQQQQQQLAMAARNAGKTAPARTRKRPTKAEKAATIVEKVNVETAQSLNEVPEQQLPPTTIAEPFSTVTAQQADVPSSSDPVAVPSSTPTNPVAENPIPTPKETIPEVPIPASIPTSSGPIAENPIPPATEVNHEVPTSSSTLVGSPIEKSTPPVEINTQAPTTTTSEPAPTTTSVNPEIEKPSTSSAEINPEIPTTATSASTSIPISVATSSTSANPPIQKSASPSTDTNPDIPTIIVTAATPEPGSKSPQKSQSDQKTESSQS